MKINGKEIGMRHSVRARLQIAALCPEKKYINIGKLFGKSEESDIDAIIKIGKILNSEYERDILRQKGEPLEDGKDYSVFTSDEVYDMDADEIGQLEREISVTLYGEQVTQTVASEPVKTKGAKNGKKKEI